MKSAQEVRSSVYVVVGLGVASSVPSSAGNASGTAHVGDDCLDRDSSLVVTL